MDTGLEIEQYFRFLINKKINNFLRKSKCEICGEIKNLEIHHSDGFEFNKIFMESLDILKIPYKKFYKEYTKEERKNLSLVLLGYHLYSWFEIICKKCHIEKHKNSTIIHYNTFITKYKNQIEEYRKIYPKATLEDVKLNYNKFYLQKYFKEILNVNLYKNDITKIKNSLIENIISNLNIYIRSKSIGKIAINRLFQQYNLPYKLTSYKNCSRRVGVRGQTYWIIEEIVND